MERQFRNELLQAEQELEGVVDRLRESTQVLQRVERLANRIDFPGDTLVSRACRATHVDLGIAVQRSELAHEAIRRAAEFLDASR